MTAGEVRSGLLGGAATAGVGIARSFASGFKGGNVDA